MAINIETANELIGRLERSLASGKELAELLAIAKESLERQKLFDAWGDGLSQITRTKDQ